LIVKSTVRERTRNWTTELHWESRGLESREAMTKYLWYNGSTSFVGGEEFKRKREDEVKAKLEESEPGFP
jgi:hypothetical protein